MEYDPLTCKCSFPKCEKKLSKTLMEHHHITPKEIDNSPTNKQIIPFCPLHHKLIFHPESSAGQHSINTPESIVILEVYDSTQGKAMHYQDFNGKKFYYFFESMKIVED